MKNYLYKSFPKDRRPQGLQYKLNKWAKADCDDDVVCCGNGLHGSLKILDGMAYTEPGYVGLVEVKGDHDKESNKQAWHHMKPLKWKKWKKEDTAAYGVFMLKTVLANALGNLKKGSPGEIAIKAAASALKAVNRNNTERSRDKCIVANRAFNKRNWDCMGNGNTGLARKLMASFLNNLGYIQEGGNPQLANIISCWQNYRYADVATYDKANDWIVEHFGIVIPKDKQANEPY